MDFLHTIKHGALSRDEVEALWAFLRDPAHQASFRLGDLPAKLRDATLRPAVFDRRVRLGTEHIQIYEVVPGCYQLEEILLIEVPE